MRKTIFLLLIFCTGCNTFCHYDKLTEKDLVKLESVNSKYTDYDITFDTCLPFGYYNVRILNDTKIDTLKLHEIFNEVESLNIEPKRMQVFDNQNVFKFILFKGSNRFAVLTKGDL